MTVVIAGTLVGVLAAVAVALKVHEAHERIKAALRDDWCDCQACAAALEATARAQLTALFNDTKEDQ